MRFTIVTPSFNQLDWLRLCVASVRDQIANTATQGAGSKEHGANRSDLCRVEGSEDAERDETGNRKPEGMREKISIEHIVQDAGTEGIEEFAREMGASFHRDGKEVFSSQSSVGSDSKADYSLTIFSEKDGGMYDAINKGLKKATGEICAYLNCDEQYFPGTLRWIADYFYVSSQTDVLFGAAIVTRADGSYVCDRRVMAPTRWHTMVSGNLSFFTSSTFFRRKSVVERGLLFDPQWRVSGDAVWALRLLDAGLRMESTHKPLSAFAETGINLSAAGNPRAAEETQRLARVAPKFARALKPLVLLHYRLRRWCSGAYALQPHEYSVYTLRDTRQRCRYHVSQPVFRWQPGVH
jgi:hypothetical protein